MLGGAEGAVVGSDVVGELDGMLVGTDVGILVGEDEGSRVGSGVRITK